MADNLKYVSGKTYSLAGSGSTASANSITIVDFADPAGNILAMTDFGDIGYLTIEPGTSRYEIVSFTGVTNNGDGTSTITGVTRGLKFKAPYDAGGYGIAHAGGAKCYISNPPQLYNEVSGKDNDETITGTWTFTSTAKPKYDIHPTFVANEELVDKKYADDLAIAGSPDASTTVKGISEEATQAEIDAGTATGGTSARLFVNPSSLNTSIYKTQLPSSDEKSALVGTSGTPGSGNKYVTNDDVASAATASKVARRNATGDITVPSTPSASTDAASKGYVDGIVVYSASDNLKVSHDANLNGTETSYTKKKTFTVYTLGTVRVKFDLNRNDATVNTMYGRIYINGVAVGTERTTTTQSPSYQTFTEDFTVNIGDQIQLYCKTSNGSFSYNVANYRLYYDLGRYATSPWTTPTTS